MQTSPFRSLMRHMKDEIKNAIDSNKEPPKQPPQRRRPTGRVRGQINNQVNQQVQMQQQQPQIQQQQQNVPQLQQQQFIPQMHQQQQQMSFIPQQQVQQQQQQAPMFESIGQLNIQSKPFNPFQQTQQIQQRWPSNAPRQTNQSNIIPLPTDFRNQDQIQNNYISFDDEDDDSQPFQMDRKTDSPKNNITNNQDFKDLKQIQIENDARNNDFYNQKITNNNDDFYQDVNQMISPNQQSNNLNIQEEFFGGFAPNQSQTNRPSPVMQQLSQSISQRRSNRSHRNRSNRSRGRVQQRKPINNLPPQMQSISSLTQKPRSIHETILIPEEISDIILGVPKKNETNIDDLKEPTLNILEVNPFTLTIQIFSEIEASSYEIQLTIGKAQQHFSGQYYIMNIDHSAKNSPVTIQSRCILQDGRRTKWSESITVTPAKIDPNAELFTNEQLLNLKIKEYKKQIGKYLPTNLQQLVGGIRNTNILVIGPIGSGKSSFINSLISAMNGTYCQYMNTMGSQDRVTSSIEKVFLTDKKMIKVCDTFGWGDEHFKEVFDLIMQGKLPDGYKISEPVDKYIKNNLVTSYDQIPHSIIIVFPATEIGNKRQIRNFVEMYNKITYRYKYKPLVVLSKCDVGIENFDIKDFYDQGDITENVEFFKRRLKEEGLRGDVMVRPFVNCQGPRLFDLKYNLLSMEYLQMAMRKSNEYVNKLWKYNLKVVDPLNGDAVIAYIPFNKLKQALLLFKSSPIVKSRIYDRYKRQFSILNRKNEKVPESEMLLSHAVVAERGGKKLYTMKIIFSDISQEEERKQKQKEEEIEQRRRNVFVYQFYHDKPKVELGGVRVDPEVDLWSLRSHIEEKIMKGSKVHFHFISGEIHNIIAEDQEPYKSLQSIMTRTKQQKLIVGIRNISEEFYLKNDDEILYFTNQSKLFIDRTLKEVRVWLRTQAEFFGAEIDQYNFLYMGCPLTEQQELSIKVKDIINLENDESVVRVEHRDQ